MDSSKKFTEEQKAEIKLIVQEALTEFFTNSGRLGKNILIGTAAVVGALLVIGGGLKMLLAALGFTYIGK